MALAHQAVEGRWLALFEIRRVRTLVTYSGWRYVFLAAATAILALPLFAARGLPAFIENIVPGFAELPADEVQNIVSMIALAKAGYVFVTLVFLRGWAARIYARAAIAGKSAKKPWPVFRLFRQLLLLAIWFGLVAQIYVSQFLNHNWWNWLNHPYLVLPWIV